MSYEPLKIEIDADMAEIATAEYERYSRHLSAADAMTFQEWLRGNFAQGVLGTFFVVKTGALPVAAHANDLASMATARGLRQRMGLPITPADGEKMLSMARDVELRMATREAAATSAHAARDEKKS